MQRPITDLLRDLRNGLLLDELAIQMQCLVNAVDETGKAGKLVLTLDVKPFAKAGGAMVIKDTIKATLPKLDNSGTVLFATPEGNLQRSNPRQEELPGIRLADEPQRRGVA
jgi:hypothetical protein